MDNLIDEILKGIFLSLLFYYSTLTNEINIMNVFKFTVFYISLVNIIEENTSDIFCIMVF